MNSSRSFFGAAGIAPSARKAATRFGISSTICFTDARRMLRSSQKAIRSHSALIWIFANYLKLAAITYSILY